MSIKQLCSPQGLLDSRGAPGMGRPHLGHMHFWERAMSRRQFIQTVAGATGAIIGSRLWMPALARADEPSDPNDPKPIPGGFQPPIPGAPFLHVFLPGHGNEPSTITDFKGAVGLANVAGTGTGTNTKTGEKTPLLFDVDMRFMKGTFIALNGRRHRGTFGFIWLDIYTGQVDPTHQIHDFNPGIAESGLFWTIRLPADSAHIDLEDATASLDVTALEIEDYHDIVNALQDGPSVPALVSFHIRWRGVKQRVKIRDTANHFAGRFIEDTATIAWSARERGFRFVSDPARTSTNEFSVIGHERNGRFFPQTEAELDSTEDLQEDLGADTNE